MMTVSNQFTLPSFAKINRLLRILGKRDDGFHELFTVFQTISLADYLTFAEADSLTMSCSNYEIPTDGQNIIIRAAQALQMEYGITKGAQIHLEKNIPSPGGMGGGSSNCAMAILGLLKLWDKKISFGELCELGTRIGADVPFFFTGGTAIGTGTGTEIESIDDLNIPFILLVTPNIDVSTATAFARINAPRLTNSSSKSILKNCCEDVERLISSQYVSQNDFEKVIFEIEPEIKRVKDALIRKGAQSALMTGSGASVFGIFEKEETRQAAIKAFVKETNWRKFAVATISRDEYREALKDVFKVVSD